MRASRSSLKTASTTHFSCSRRRISIVWLRVSTSHTTVRRCSRRRAPWSAGRSARCSPRAPRTPSRGRCGMARPRAADRGACRGASPRDPAPPPARAAARCPAPALSTSRPGRPRRSRSCRQGSVQVADSAGVTRARAWLDVQLAVDDLALEVLRERLEPRPGLRAVLHPADHDASRLARRRGLGWGGPGRAAGARLGPRGGDSRRNVTRRTAWGTPSRRSRSAG